MQEWLVDEPFCDILIYFLGSPLKVKSSAYMENRSLQCNQTYVFSTRIKLVFISNLSFFMSVIFRKKCF